MRLFFSLLNKIKTFLGALLTLPLSLLSAILYFPSQHFTIKKQPTFDEVQVTLSFSYDDYLIRLTDVFLKVAE